MRKILCLICIISFSNQGIAQPENDTIILSKNYVSINLLGDASLVSINYERLFYKNSRLFFSAKAGIGTNIEFQLFNNNKPPEKYTTFPHHISCNIKMKKRFIEFGIGGTYINGNTTQPYLLYPLVGLRFQPFKKTKFNIRVFALYPFNLVVEDIFFSPYGFSIGVPLK